jgi:glutaminyl-tRNA synthetase
VRCTYDPATRGGNAPDNRKVKSTIHWVSSSHAAQIAVRVYENLFSTQNPLSCPPDGSFLDNLNPKSMSLLPAAYAEPRLADAPIEARYQFERLGYFVRDPDTLDGKPVFNKTVGLKDTWLKTRPAP